MEKPKDNTKALVALCFFIIYVVWGSTYLANAWATKEIPPYLLAGIRFSIAGVVLLGITRIFGPLTATKRQLRNCAIVGLLMFSIGNGLAVWSLKYINSGISAIVIALQPLVVVMIEWLFQGKRPNRATVVGIFLGVVGVGLLVGQPQFQTGWGPMLGFFALIVALLAWGSSTVWIPVADLPRSMLERTALQMLFGSAILIATSACIGEIDMFTPSEISPRVWWSLAYLVVFGSLMAMTAFNFLLVTIPPSKVVTNTYVNPVIAVFLGWWLNDEPFQWTTLVAAAFLLTGVFLIVHNRRRQRPLTAPSQPSPAAAANNQASAPQRHDDRVSVD
ncbi:MAG: EamA family transporter [Planctomycetaceae bacterium]